MVKKIQDLLFQKVIYLETRYNWVGTLHTRLVPQKVAKIEWAALFSMWIVDSMFLSQDDGFLYLSD